MMRRALLRSCSTHQAKSSKAAGSNSKLLAGFVKADPFLAILRCQQSPLHILALEQVGGFPFRLDFTPQFYWDYGGNSVALLVCHVLDFRKAHRFCSSNSLRSITT